MWYLIAPSSVFARVNHSITELRAIGTPGLYLAAGLMIQNNSSGTLCPGCVQGHQDFDARRQSSYRNKRRHLVGPVFSAN